MIESVEQITESARLLPSEATALLADRLIESLDSAEDGHIHWLKAAKAQRGCRKHAPAR